ncbi:APC family permease [Nonomuraea cypriaca]|uniref:APC family permease n=1 Tax=Nonomuraea cypriaca TaxID=1187855 RepID=UPI0022A86A4D|nr:APC family permease [Nonomuraea cypriaca]
MTTETPPTDQPDPSQATLHRGLSVRGVVALAVSDITPMASLLIIAPVVLGLAGTASFWAYLVGCFLAICVALCMGELGSMYPVAGGLYSIVHRVLGRPLGFLALIDYIAQGVFLPASIALGVGTYLHALHDSIPINLSSAIAMAVVTLLAVLRIHVGAVLVAVFLAIEVIVIGVLSVAGFLNWNQPLSILFAPVIADGATLTSVGAGVVVAALAITMFSVNGYDSAINFSEETRGAPSNIGKAVVIAAAAGIVLELVPFVGGLFGAQNLNAYLSSATPLTDLVGTLWGDTAKNIIIVGALFAVINAILAITLQFSRILWSSARDKAWPTPVNHALSRVHPTFRSPWVATLLTGGVATVLCFASDLVTAVTFTAVLIIALYGLVAVAALVSRIRDKGAERPSRMPLWPLPPVLVLVGIIIAITQQTARDIWIVAILFAVGLVYYYVFLHRSRQERWVPHTIAEETILEQRT